MKLKIYASMLIMIGFMCTYILVFNQKKILVPISENIVTIKKNYGYLYDNSRLFKIDLYTNNFHSLYQFKEVNEFCLIDKEESYKIELQCKRIRLLREQKWNDEIYYPLSLEFFLPQNEYSFVIEEAILKINNEKETMKIAIGYFEILNFSFKTLDYHSFSGAYKGMKLEGIQINFGEMYDGMRLNSIVSNGDGKWMEEEIIVDSKKNYYFPLTFINEYYLSNLYYLFTFGETTYILEKYQDIGVLNLHEHHAHIASAKKINKEEIL